MNKGERYETILTSIAHGMRANPRNSNVLPQTLGGAAGEFAKDFIEFIDQQPISSGFVDLGDWQHKARSERVALAMVNAHLQASPPQDYADAPGRAALIQAAYNDAENVMFQADSPSFPPVLQGGS